MYVDLVLLCDFVGCDVSYLQTAFGNLYFFCRVCYVCVCCLGHSMLPRGTPRCQGKPDYKHWYVSIEIWSLPPPTRNEQDQHSPDKQNAKVCLPPKNSRKHCKSRGSPEFGREATATNRVPPISGHGHSKKCPQPHRPNFPKLVRNPPKPGIVSPFGAQNRCRRWAKR